MLAPGTKLGPYEILAPLGAGGMGEVYRARDTRLDRTVAIKVLPEELSANPERRQRFEREARIISSLNHPHICALYDIGHQDGVDYLVLEYLQGEELANRLERGPMPSEQVLRYGIEIADALHKAHRQGVTHRDLKPGNIMLTRHGAKLLDFGLAKASRPLTPSPSPQGRGWPSGPGEGPAAPTGSLALTAEGTLVGTFHYMAPEQFEGKEADARSDIFALGAVLYEMATGRKAFEGKTPASVMAAILEREPQPITAIQPLAPPALDHLVRTCLAKDPEERWQAAQDVKLELQGIVEAGSQGGVDSRRPAPPTEPLLRSSLLPPRNFSFAPYNFAVSPDGARLAFVAVGPDGKDTLWVRALSAPGAQQLEGTERAAFPFWSPDSRRIGFFAEGRLKTVDIAGGMVKIVCEALLGRGGTWNRDGTIVFAPSVTGPLHRVPASGGVPTPAIKIARQGGGHAHRWPFFLPDGKHFLYFVDSIAPEDPQSRGIYVGSLDSGEPKLISSDLSGNVAYASGNLLYVRDRMLLAQPFDLDQLETTAPPVPLAEQELEHDFFWRTGFSASENGVLVFQSAADSPSRLVWFDSSGQEVQQMPQVGYNYPRLSPDGLHLAVASDDEHNGRYYIRVCDLERGVSTRLSDAVIEATEMAWSRDGKRIAYATVRADTYCIEEIASDGSGPAQVLLKGAKMIPNDWSPDGHLVFMDLMIGLSSLAVYSASDHQVTRLPAAVAEGQFSPDGKWVAYIASGGRASEIFVQPFPGPGGRIQISSAGGSQPRWSRDGRQVFYVQPDRKLMAVSFDPQRGSPGAPRALFQTRIVAPAFALFQYDVSPDGRFLINSFPSNSSSPLTLLTGWTALVKAP